MLIRTEGRSNPLAEISSIAGFWFFWGTIFGICGLATAQRVIDAVSLPADSEHVADISTVAGTPPMPLGSAIPTGAGPSDL